MNEGATKRRKVFTRRAAILAAGMLGLTGWLGARLYRLQVIDAEKYRLLSDDNRISPRLLAPARGRIVDRDGVPLALNEPNYCLIMVPEAAGDVAEALDRLSAYVALDTGERERIAREAATLPPFMPVLISEHLTWLQLAAIEVNAPYLPGVSIETRQRRFYPHGAALAHVLGYVGAVSEEERTGDRLLELPGFPIGKNGIEKIHDVALRGNAGARQVEVNAHGREIRELWRREGASGRDVALSVDLGLQKFAIERLGEESAAAVVIDVGTGGVLALASSPAFDPNIFSHGLSRDEWRTLVEDPRAPLRNKAVAGQYPPGSTFKPVVALAALEAGAVDPEETVFCPGHRRLGDRRFHCWKRGGHGKVAMREAIARSCDVYFYDVALRVGIERIAAMAHRLGFGEPLGLDLPNEAPGLIPTPAWKQAVRGEPWQKGETLGVGIGQSFVLATPLQLAVMTARLANGKSAVTPHVTRSPHNPGFAKRDETPPALGVSAAALAIVRDGMDKAVNARRGTAFDARIEEQDMALAGKTGTSQVRRITAAERTAGMLKDADRPWKHRDHKLFVGYAPRDAPRFAVSVVVEHGGDSVPATPLARDILMEAQRRIPLPALTASRPGDEA